MIACLNNDKQQHLCLFNELCIRADLKLARIVFNPKIADEVHWNLLRVISLKDSVHVPDPPGLPRLPHRACVSSQKQAFCEA